MLAARHIFVISKVLAARMRKLITARARKSKGTARTLAIARKLKTLTASGIVYCVIVIKHVAFFAVCVTLTMAVTLTSLLLNFCSSVSGSGCGFRFEQNFWRIDGFGQKRHGFAYSYPLPSTQD